MEPMGRNYPSIKSVTRSETWFAVFVYMLFAFSFFSITGIELAVIALYFLAIHYYLNTKPQNPFPRWILIPFFMWVVALVVSALANPDPLTNLGNLRHQYRIVLPFLLLPALAKFNLGRLLKFYLIIVVIFAVYGISQTFFAFDVYRHEFRYWFAPIFISTGGLEIFRARGSFAGPGTFGICMMMTGLLFASIFIRLRGKHRYWWALGAGLAVLGLVASFSRAAWVGMLAGLLVLSLQLPRRWSVGIISASLIAFVAFALFIESGWLFRHPELMAKSAVLQRVAIAGADISVLSRFYLWRAALRSISEHPYLGVSFKNRKAILPHLGITPPYIRARMPVSDAGADTHNIYLQVAFDLGLLGLVAYLGIWGAVFSWNEIWIQRAADAFPLETGILWGATSALTGVAIVGFFHDPFFSGYANTTILMFMGLSLFSGLRIRAGLKD